MSDKGLARLWMRLLVWLGLKPGDSVEEESRRSGTALGGSGMGLERPAKARNAGLGIEGLADPYVGRPEGHAAAERRRLARVEQEKEAERKAREESRQRHEAQRVQERSIWDNLERAGREDREKAVRITEGEKPTNQIRQGPRMSP